MTGRLQFSPIPFIAVVERNLSEQDQQIVYAADPFVRRDIMQLADNTPFDAHAIDDRIGELVNQNYLIYESRGFTRPESHALKGFRVTG